MKLVYISCIPQVGVLLFVNLAQASIIWEEEILFKNIYLLCIHCSVCTFACLPEEGIRFHFRWL